MKLKQKKNICDVTIFILFYNIGDVLCVCINLFKIYINIKLKLEFHETTSHLFSLTILLSVILLASNFTFISSGLSLSLVECCNQTISLFCCYRLFFTLNTATWR